MGLGVLVARATARIEHSQWSSQKVVESRLKVFDTVAPWLNQLVCFYTFVGRWKDLRPDDVIRIKRDLDEVMHVNRLLFSEEFFEAYLDFTRMLFETYGSVDRDAPLRAHITIPNGNRRSLAWWNESTMVGCFATNGIPRHPAIPGAGVRATERCLPKRALNPTANLKDRPELNLRPHPRWQARLRSQRRHLNHLQPVERTWALHCNSEPSARNCPQCGCCVRSTVRHLAPEASVVEAGPLEPSFGLLGSRGTWFPSGGFSKTLDAAPHRE